MVFDIIGLALMAYALVQSDMFKLRVASIGVCLYYIGYAAVTNNQALLLPNALILALHCFALYKEKKVNESLS